MNGLDTLHAMRKLYDVQDDLNKQKGLKPLKFPKIAFFTVQKTDKFKAHCKENGVDFFLEKPISMK